MRCPGCGTEVAPTRRSCPLCQALIHGEELKRLAREAEEAEAADRPAEALHAWRRALELLPPASGQAEAITRRAEALSRKVEVSGGAGTPAGGLSGVWKGGGLAAVLIFLLTKAKFLLLGFTKLGTLGSMILSLGVYWAVFGWKLALGLILSIYVHEMGHVAALSKLGFPASAPTFIPGLGAFIRLKQRPVSPREDARVGLAGPLWGLAAALVALGVHLAGGGPIWAALARIGAWINLFNLLPLGPLDGGRAFGALSKGQRLIIAAWIGGVWFFTHEGLLLLLLIGAVLWLWGPRKEEEGDRLAFFQYAGLVAVLGALCMLPVPGVPS
ncbi:MAG TPA: site-2 protease family protein [Acidobacteria bacterium]|nr:site-2 protease family protein [Acidobacteriota bacterium]